MGDCGRSFFSSKLKSNFYKLKSNMMKCRLLQWTVAFCLAFLLGLGGVSAQKLVVAVNDGAPAEGTDFATAMKAAGYDLDDAAKLPTIAKVVLERGHFKKTDWEVFKAKAAACTAWKTFEVKEKVKMEAFAENEPEMPYFASSVIESVHIMSSFDIPVGMFKGAKALKSISLDCAKHIMKSAFEGCSMLEDVQLPSTETIESMAFKGCVKVASLRLPAISGEEGAVAESAFEGMTALTSFYAPQLTSVEKNTFKGCSRLTELNLPSCTTFSEKAFEGNTTIKTIVAPKLTGIGEATFKGCSALERLAAPSLQEVADEGFSGCAALKEAIFPSLSGFEVSNFFNGCNALEKAMFAQEASFPEDLFKGCAAFKTWVLNGVPETEFANSSFEGCPEKRSLVLTSDEAVSLFEEDENYKSSTKTWFGWKVPKKANFPVRFTIQELGEENPVAGARIKVAKDGTTVAELLTNADGGALFIPSVAGDYTYEIDVEHSTTPETGEDLRKGTFTVEKNAQEETELTLAAIVWKKVQFSVPKTTPHGSLIVSSVVEPEEKGEFMVYKGIEGSLISFTVTPEDGYELATFTVNGKPIAAEAKYELTEEATFAITFEKPEVPPTIMHKVEISSSMEHGSLKIQKVLADDSLDPTPIKSGDEVADGTTLRITAIPETGYKLKAIDAVANGASVTIHEGDDYHVTAPVKFYADFEIRVMYTLTMTQTAHGKLEVRQNLENLATGQIASKEFDENTLLNITVIPDEGYQFDKLVDVNDGNETLRKKGPTPTHFPYFVEKTTEVKAYFIKIPLPTISVTSNGNGTITVFDADNKELSMPAQVKKGAVLTLVMTPAAGYQADKLWEAKTETGKTKDLIASEGKEVDKAISVTYTVTGSARFTAVFNKPGVNNHVISFTQPSATEGTLRVESDHVLNNGELQPHNTKIYITVSPAAGYELDKLLATFRGQQPKKLLEGGKTEQTIDVDLVDNLSIVATFKPASTTTPQYTVTFSTPTNGTLTVKNGSADVTTGATLNANTELTLTATPVTGYKLDKLVAVVGSETKELAKESKEAVTVTYKLEANVTLKATFSEVTTTPQYTVTFSAPTNGTLTVKNGSADVTTGATLDANTELTLTATPAQGYALDKLVAVVGSETKELAKESKEAVTVPYKLEANVTFKATFKAVENQGGDPTKYTVSFDAPQNGTLSVKNGSADVSTGATLDANTELTLTATPATGYKLDKLVAVVGSETKELAKESKEAVTVTYKLEANVTLKATFSEVTTTPQYTVTFSAPTNGTLTVKNGSADVTTGATLNANTELTLTATPVTGYKLDKLVAVVGSETKELAKESKEAVTVTYKLEANVTLKATFSEVTTTPQYTVTFSAPTNGTLTVKNGSADVTTGATLNANTELTLTATPVTGYKLDKLVAVVGSETKELAKESKEAVTVTYKLEANVTLKATFSEVTTTPQYTVTFSAPTNGTLTVKNGSADVTTGATLNANTELTLTATPVTGYKLDKLVAVVGSETKELAKESKEAVTVTYKLEANVTLTATFKEVKNDPPISAPQYTVTFDAPTNGTLTVKNGSADVATGATLDANTELTLTATPATGYKLDKLVAVVGSETKELAKESKEAVTVTYKLEANVTLTATFKEVKNDPPISAPQYTVTFDAPTNGTLTVKNGSADVATGATLDANTELTLTATPATGYKLDKLVAVVGSETKELAKESKEAVTVTYKLEANVTLTATFKEVKNDPPISAPQYTVTFDAPTNGTLTVKNGSADVATGATLDANTELTLTATPATGYKLDKLVAVVGSETKELAKESKEAVTVTHKLEADVKFVATFKKVNANDNKTPQAVDEALFAQVQLFPNPVAEVLNLRGVENVESATLVNAMGETLSTLYCQGASELQCYVADLPAGLYFVTLRSGEAVRTLRFIKR